MIWNALDTGEGNETAGRLELQARFAASRLGQLREIGLRPRGQIGACLRIADDFLQPFVEIEEHVVGEIADVCESLGFGPARSLGPRCGVQAYAKGSDQQ